MKILMVNDYAERIGGAEGYMYNLAEELRGKGHEVAFFTSEVSREAYYEGLGSISWWVLLKRLWNEPVAHRFGRMVAEFTPDVVHIHSLYNELSPAFLRYVGDARVILTVHDQRLYAAVTNQRERSGQACNDELCVGCVNCVGLLGSLYASLRWRVHRHLYSRVDAFVFPSMYMKSLFARYTDLEPLWHVPNGFTLPEYVPWRRNNRVLFIGRLTRDKGADILIQAVSTFEQAQLVIVGDGEDEDYLKDLVKKLEIQDQVEFLGKLEHADVIEKIGMADVVCIPSQYPDNLPTVGIEALGVGRAIVASKIGGLPELVEDGVNGYLVEVGDIEQMQDRLRLLLFNDSLATRMSKLSNKISHRYTIDSHVKDILDLYLA